MCEETMNLLRCLVIGVACGLLLCVRAYPADKDDKPDAKGVEGIWQGKLKVGAIELRLVFHVSKKDDGYTAKMDSPDQGATGLACDEVAFKDGMLRIELNKIGGKYEGKISADGKEIDGEWKQSGQTFPLKLQRTKKAPTTNRPQEPKPPFPYREEEVSYENKKAGAKFAGTLTLPKEGGPFPAVVLITGSGPQDRNESLMGHKPFLVLADYLTRHGIAVVRVDDRGVGGSTGDTMSSTTADFAEDAIAGVQFLKGRKDIDPTKIGLIGHSEGGIIAPLAASRCADVAFIVLLAGTGLAGEQIMYLQGERVARSMGAGDKDIATARQTQQEIFRSCAKRRTMPRRNNASSNWNQSCWPSSTTRSARRSSRRAAPWRCRPRWC
jgi:pimeloyl-ACP methyl ester carboxylesterase